MEVRKKTQHSLRPGSRHEPACTTDWKKWLWSIAFIAPLLPSTVFADTYADTFASGTYTGSNGTLAWPAATPWIETTDDGNAGTGKVWITGGRVEIEGNNRMLQRAFDVTAYANNGSTGTIVYTIDEDFNSASDFLIVELSTNGGSSYSQLRQIGNGQDGTYTDTITSLLSTGTPTTFILRFRSVYNNTNDDAFVDNVVITLTAPPPPSCSASGSTAGVEYEDQFDCQDYTATNGSVNWAGTPWIEVGDDADPTAGGIAIINDSAAALDSVVYSLRMNTTDSIYRVVNLSNAAYETANLVFDYRCTSSTDFTADASIDGGVNWTNLGDFAGCNNSGYLTTSSLNLDNYLESNTRVRFNVSSAGEVLIDKVSSDPTFHFFKR